MSMISSQFFGDGLTNIIWFLLFILLAFLYPRIMIAQMLFRLEQTAQMLEGFTLKAKGIILRKISKRPKKDLKQAITHFLEFFMIQPVSLDPFGIVKKIEHIVNLSEKRFKYFVSRIAPHLNSEEKASLIMGLSGAISLNQLAKTVRHYVELIRKTKNLQLALLLQMQLPLIERISKALLKGTEALTNGWPVGDSVGAFVAAHLIGKEKVREIEVDTILARRKIKGKEVYIIKAKGPGGRLGKMGRAVEKIVRREKIAKIITIDAALKLEGEKTGSIAEGVGVAIGGIGVDRAYIENLAVKKNIPLDSIIIKMSQEEAIQPIKKEILASIPRVISLVEKNIGETKEKGRIIVVGVGNTSGVGNSKKEAEKAEKLAKRVLIREKVKERKKKRFF
ncbi:MAG: DUF1512 domain-containing protein [Candidatus Aenigmatarchaeota archaeon]|nr:MAG: DUF1512 domain-containing protein [Candidatus Aenigmarchaeota archaeon]